jgi:hypothetical protein
MTSSSGTIDRLYHSFTYRHCHGCCSVKHLTGIIHILESRSRWRDNIRIDLWEVGCEVVDWMHLAQDMDQWRLLVNTVMNLPVP